jgi:hypothetical protein
MRTPGPSQAVAWPFPHPWLANAEASLRALEWALHSARLQAGTAGAETLVLLPHSHMAAATDLRTHPLVTLVATTPLHSPAFALTLPATTAAPQRQSAPSDDPATWDDEETEDEPDTSAAPCKPLSFDSYLVSSRGAPAELLHEGHKLPARPSAAPPPALCAPGCVCAYCAGLLGV